MGLFVLLDQHLQNASVAPDRWVRALGQQINDLGITTLPISVHPSVALREDHEGPGDVEVDEPVALMVEIDAFGRHVGSQEEPEWRGLVAEVLDDILLVGV